MTKALSTSRLTGTNPANFLEALDKGESVVKDRIILSGVGGTAFRQSSVEDQDLQASR